MPTQQEVRNQLAAIDEAAAKSGTPAGIALAERPDTVNTLLENPEVQKRLQASLPATWSQARFEQVVLMVMRGNDRLKQCTAGSIVAAAVQVAQLGLELGPLGEAYIVPYWNKDLVVAGKQKKGGFEAQLQIGYHGFVTLAHRAGVTVEARTVCENDDFDYGQGTGVNKFIRFKKALRDRGEAIAYYALASWRTPAGDPAEVFEVMSVEEIQAHREAYANDNSPAWRTSFDVMAMKTVLKQLSRWFPKSVTIAAALAADEAVRSIDAVAPNMADDAWVEREQAIGAERAAAQLPAPPPPPADADGAAADAAVVDEAGVADGKCAVCNWDLPEHADGCQDG